MDCHPQYMFGHATIAGLLASRDNILNTYAKYVSACNRQGITCYNEACYNDFMEDCGRPLIVEAT